MRLETDDAGAPRFPDIAPQDDNRGPQMLASVALILAGFLVGAALAVMVML